MKKLLFIFILFITSCGYQPIYISQNQDDFIFKKITLSGERQTNKTIINALAIKEKSTLNSNKELFLQADLKVEKTSKNSKGQITSYRSTVTVNLAIKEDNQTIKDKKFIQSFTYNNLDNKFDLTEYQNEIKKDIINKIIEEIIIYMNL
tara:strand:+ start:1721 stop:2167 length:447 start_codon:yes stop_codon:yes gene_type:complete